MTIWGRLSILVLVMSSTAVAARISNDDVLRMVRRGVPVAEMVDRINHADSHFKLYPEDVASLRKKGVPEVVIRAMFARQTGETLNMSTMSTAPAAIPAASAAPAPQPIPTAIPGRTRQFEDDNFGIAPGTVLGEGAGGFTFSSAISPHPHAEGGILVGLHRYFGLYAQGGYSQLASGSIACTQSFCSVSAKADIKYFAGGIEAVASNPSRFVPYGKVGFAYTRGGASVSSGNFAVSASIGVPAITFGGGARFYIRHKFGVLGDVSGYRFVGPYGGATIGTVAFGIFIQSK